MAYAVFTESPAFLSASAAECLMQYSSTNRSCLVFSMAIAYYLIRQEKLYVSQKNTNEIIGLRTAKT